MDDTEKADMPSGRLAFATRRVDLMAAGMRAPLALCADGMTILPHKAWEKLDGSSSRSAWLGPCYKFLLESQASGLQVRVTVLLPVPN